MIDESSSMDDEVQDQPDANIIRLHEEEQVSIQKLRHKIRITDPKSLYKYRHIKLSNWHSLFHLLTLLLSFTLLFIFCIGIFKFSFTELEGVGKVSDLTIIDKVSASLILIIMFFALKSLRNNLKKTPIALYGLGMFSNSLNRALLNNIKLYSYPIVMIMGIFFVLTKYNLNTDIDPLFNGIECDLISGIFDLLSVIIFYRAFSSCFKGLE